MLRLSSIALLCALGFAAFNAPARAEDAPAAAAPNAEKGEHHREGRFGDRMRERLHEQLFEGITLSDDQKAQLEKKKEEGKAEMEKFREEHKAEFDAQKAWHDKHAAELEAAGKKIRDAAQAQDRKALQAAREDMKTILESRPKLDEKTKAGMPSLEKMEASIRSVLTADQAKIFDENVKKIEAKKEEWKDRGPGGPPAGGDDGKPHHRKHAKDAGGDKPADAPPAPPAPPAEDAK